MNMNPILSENSNIKNLVLPYLLVLVVFFFIAGCSSAFKAENYSSVKKFYGEFNTHAQNRYIKITLNNDSTFIAHGPEIINDSLVLNNNSLAMKRSLPLWKIKTAGFKNYSPAVPIGVGTGMITGGITTGLISSKNSPVLYETVVIGVLSGAILGGAAGILIGWNTYISV